eukprot:jgi/Tetstr1/446751/TSEL_034238.t1
MPKTARPSTPSAVYDKRKKRKVGGRKTGRAGAGEAQQPLDSSAADAYAAIEAGAEPPEGTEGATEEGEADAIEDPDQKSRTAARLNKPKELHAHYGELVLTVEAEDNKCYIATS